MRITGQAGVDGGEGALSKTMFRCVGAGGSAILFHPTEKMCILGECMIYSQAPGNQTVCRAEAWALYNIIHVWPGKLELTINVEATYSLSGMDLVRREMLLKGANSDIWEVIFAELAAKTFPPL